MSNTAEIFEDGEGYSVTAQNTDGPVFVDSLSIEEDAFEHIESAVQEDGRTAYDAEEGYEFILEGDQRVGSRIGYLHCVEEQQVEQFEVPYSDRYTFNEMVSELGVPDTEQAYDALNFLPPMALVVDYDKTEGEATPVAVKVGGKTYELEDQS